MPTLDELYKSLHVGAENELGGTCLKLWDDNIGDFVEPDYGVYIAKTEAGDLNIPKMGIHPDGVNKANKTAIIEHVGGARKTVDSVYEEQLKNACQISISPSSSNR